MIRRSCAPGEPLGSCTPRNVNTQPEIQPSNSSHRDATEETPLLESQSITERYSVFSNHQKRLIVLTAATASAFSPLSANIYYPALNSIAADLGVNNSQINLTITTYMVWYSYSHTFSTIDCIGDL